MKIEELTLKEINQLIGLFKGENKYPIEIGKKYLFRTVTHINSGRVVAVVGDYAVIVDAAWIADTGNQSHRWADSLREGFCSEAEIEPWPDGWEVSVNLAACIDFCEWPHDLPRKQQP